MKQIVLVLALLPALAFADSVNVSVRNQVMKGKGVPAVMIEILEPIAGFRLTLARDGGKLQEWKGGGKPGVTRTIELVHPDGMAKWAGELVINLPNGTTGTMPMEFDTEIVGPLAINVDLKKDFDPVARKVRFTVNQPIVKAHLKVMMDTGAVVADSDIPFESEPAGTRLEVSWPEAKGQAMMVNLRVYAKSGVFNGIEVTNWQVNIPHEEVNFASGKSDVAAEETAKLENSLKVIQDAIDKYGSLADIKLYILGHTDTVGPTAANRTLSFNRARAIGSWFKKKGLRVPVLYEGFGEEAPLVATPDETAEVKNRRADYVLSIGEPTLTGGFPYAPKWQRL